MRFNVATESADIAEITLLVEMKICISSFLECLASAYGSSFTQPNCVLLQTIWGPRTSDFTGLRSSHSERMKSRAAFCASDRMSRAGDFDRGARSFYRIGSDLGKL
jgi:hypothetical protein